MTDIVYGNLKVTPETREDLIAYCENELGFYPNNAEDFHCTFIYSRETSTAEELMKLGEEINSQIQSIPVVASPTELTHLGDAIVLKLNSELIEGFFNQAYRLGATHDYPEFTCHLSLHYTTDKEIDIDDRDLPLFPIRFDRCEVIMSTDEYDPLSEHEEEPQPETMEVEGFGTVRLQFGESIFRNYAVLGKIEEANKSNWSQYWIAKVAKRLKRPANRLHWKMKKDPNIAGGMNMMYLVDKDSDANYLAYNPKTKELSDWIDDNSGEDWNETDFDIETSTADLE